MSRISSYDFQEGESILILLLFWTRYPYGYYGVGGCVAYGGGVVDGGSVGGCASVSLFFIFPSRTVEVSFTDNSFTFVLCREPLEGAAPLVVVGRPVAARLLEDVAVEEVVEAAVVEEVVAVG